MVKSHVKSWFEVWSEPYINSPDIRIGEEKDYIILQIEHSVNEDYIVELIKPEDYKSGYFSAKEV
jgi:hypothetical protein